MIAFERRSCHIYVTMKLADQKGGKRLELHGPSALIPQTVLSLRGSSSDFFSKDLWSHAGYLRGAREREVDVKIDTW